MVRGFSSMGAPGLSLAGLRELARRFSLDFIELRTVCASTDLPGLLERGALGEAEGDDVPVRLVASDLRLLEAGPGEVEAFLRYAAVAEHLRAPYVRVFGGGNVGQELGEDDLERVAERLDLCREEMSRRGFGAEILMETHFAFSSARMCRALNDRLRVPVSLLWDSHHTWRRSNESPESAWAMIGPWIRHIHYKDSRLRSGSGIDGCYVPPGEGEFPTMALMKHLRANGYSHGLSLEWEKLWHPELPGLDEVLPAFVALTSEE
jgi:sugar phosphate isomerase/epimerase